MWVLVLLLVGGVTGYVLRNQKKRWGYLFIVQALLLEMSVLSGLLYFFDCTLFPHCNFISEQLERGSFEAIGSAAGTVGIGNFLFVWIYSERDKVVLGKLQIELIEETFENGYAASIIIHFSATVLCLLFAKSSARESSLLAFLTLIWGCALQAYICVVIALNKKESEKRALSLWEKGGNDIENLNEMIKFLDQKEIYNHSGYRDLLFKKIAYWLNSVSSVKKIKFSDIIQKTEKR